MDKIIQIKPEEEISTDKIVQVLNGMLRSGSCAKFITDGYYIQFNFSRDGNISCSSNIRNTTFLHERNYYDRVGWNISLAAHFVYQWMSLYRRTLY